MLQLYSTSPLQLHYIQPASFSKKPNIQPAIDEDTIETEFLVDLVSSRCGVNAFSSLTYKQQYPFIPFFKETS